MALEQKQAVNPYLPSWEYIPDGEPRVFGDRLYVYGSHDRFDGEDFCVNDYMGWSAPVEHPEAWECNGVIYRSIWDPANPDGSKKLFAPDVVQGLDGRYYLYYQLDGIRYTSVAVSDTPKGPFSYYGKVQHPDGTPWGEKPGDVFAFDPGILIDDDQRIYLYLGFAPNTEEFRAHLQKPGNNVDGGVCVELQHDMLTVIGEERPTIPGHFFADGTEFEGHAFYEASSIRKIDGTYYLVYSSELSHELCYAVSDYPDRDFHYGGTIVSIGDVGYEGRTEPLNYTGNTHGGLVELNGTWYIFYHRQTNLQKCARQGCAEPVHFLPDGSIPQVPVSSCGLNGGLLRGRGSYDAYIACALSSAKGTIPLLATHEEDPEHIHPYFTQDAPDNEGSSQQYIANLRDGSWAGYRWFAFEGCRKVTVVVRATGSGEFCVLDELDGAIVGKVKISPCEDWTAFEGVLEISDGLHPLVFRYQGDGAVDFLKFTLESERRNRDV